MQKEGLSSESPDLKGFGAGEEIRTLDIFLGKEVLYQLSYARVNEARKLGEQGARAQGDFLEFSTLPAALPTRQ